MYYNKIAFDIMEIVSSLCEVQESLASLALNPQSIKKSDPYILNNFESPELAIFDKVVGPVILSKLPNADKTLEDKVITAFMDGADDINGMMMRRIKGNNYFGLTFNVNNKYTRGGQDVYASLISEGQLPVIEKSH